jgi:hypothetical protein
MLDLGEVACLVRVLVQRISKEKETTKGKKETKWREIIDKKRENDCIPPGDHAPRILRVRGRWISSIAWTC